MKINEQKIYNHLIAQGHSPINVDETGWVTAVINGRWVQAKVYDEPSTYGVRDCRVSKLCVGLGDTRNTNANFFKQMAYSYDRGLDFHNKKSLKTAELSAILDVLNSIPTWR